VKTYFGSFDEDLWGKMDTLASLEKTTITNWIDEKVRKNINSINANNYQENKDYQRKKIRLKEDLHRKIKTESHLQECSMRDIIQAVIEKEYKKVKNKTLDELLN